jgi:hypothetical protein
MMAWLGCPVVRDIILVNSEMKLVIYGMHLVATTLMEPVEMEMDGGVTNVSRVATIQINIREECVRWISKQ